MNKFFYIILFFIIAYSANSFALDDLLEPETKSEEFATPEGRGEEFPEVTLPEYESGGATKPSAIVPQDNSNQAKEGIKNLPSKNKNTQTQINPSEANVQNEIKASYTPFNGYDKETLNSDFQSFFFSQEQVDYLYNKIKRFKQTGQNIQSIISDVKAAANEMSGDISGEKDEQIQKTASYKKFFLTTILYPKDTNWTIWINDQKIRKPDAENQKDFAIKSVTEDSVTLIHRSEDINIDSPNFRTALNFQENQKTNVAITDQGANYSSFSQKKVGEIITNQDLLNTEFSWDYISENGNIKLASYDGVIEFTLKLRQTFSVYDMKIYEGDTDNSANKSSVDNADLKETINAIEELKSATNPNAQQPKPEENKDGKKNSDSDKPAALPDSQPKNLDELKP